MRMQKNAVRWAAVALALGLGVVACSTPTTTDVEMGQQIRFTLPAEAGGDALLGRTQEIVGALSAWPGVDDVSVNVRDDDRQTTLELLVWGDDLDVYAITTELGRRFGVLGSAELETQPLHTEIQEPFYAKVSREVLKIEVGGGTDEEIRARILEQLFAQGFGEGTDVRLHRADGMTTLEIDAVGDGMEQEAVIEVIGDGPIDSIELGSPAGDGEGNVTVERVQKQ